MLEHNHPTATEARLFHDIFKKPRATFLYGTIAAMVLIWTGNFLAAKIGLRYFEPLALATLRVETASVLMLLIFLVARARRMAEPAGRFERGDLWRFALLGLLGVAMNQMLFTIGLKYTTVGHSALIIGAGPIATLLLARLQRLELLTVNKLLGMVLSFSGVAILALEKGVGPQGATLKGDLITLSGSLAFACYTVISKPMASRFDPLTLNAYSYLAGGLLVLPLALPQASALNWRAVSWPGWAALVYMAVFSSVAAYLIFYWALRYLAASRVAAFTYFQPILATLLGFAILGERITVHLLAGGALVLTGVYLAERRRLKQWTS